MLRAQWSTLVSLFKAPPSPPIPLVDRETVNCQLRIRAHVVPMAVDPAQPVPAGAVAGAATASGAHGTPPVASAGSKAAARG
jgi:hypothetical protein